MARVAPLGQTRTTKVNDMIYGNIDTGYFELNGYLSNPDQVALGIALAMPSVETSGARSKRGGLRQPGLGAHYHATSMNWVGDVTQGIVDHVWFAAVRGSTDKRPGGDSSKQNHLTGLCNAGLIQRFKTAGVWQTALTDAGLAQVKAVNGELGKLAKAYTVTAYAKALKAAERAAKVSNGNGKPKAKKAKVEQVEVEPVGFEPVEGEPDFVPVDCTAPTVTADAV